MLFGQRYKQLRQLFWQLLHPVDDGVLLAEDVRDIFIGLAIEVNSIGINALPVQLHYRLARILDQ